MVEEMLIAAARVMFWIGLFMDWDIYLQEEKDKRDIEKLRSKGDTAMFDKKEMKLIRFNKIGDYMMKGEPVFMVMLDGSMEEITEDTDNGVLLFHNLRGGSYAVYRRKVSGLGTFTRSINIGRWSVSVSHIKKGGEN